MATDSSEQADGDQNYPELSDSDQLKNYPELSKSLPADYEYRLCSFSPIDGGYLAEFRVAITVRDGATKWLVDYQQKNKITLRVHTTKPESGRVNLFKVYYRCQHNTLPRSDKADLRLRSKNTCCPAQVVLTLKRNPGKRSRAKFKDPYLPKFATHVKIRHNHNHSIICADALKFRDVSEEVTETFRKLFSKGHSPSSALNTYKLEMQLKYGNEYLYEVADRAKCPDLQFCHRLYRKMFNKSYRAVTGEKMMQIQRPDMSTVELQTQSHERHHITNEILEVTVETDIEHAHSNVDNYFQALEAQVIKVAQDFIQRMKSNPEELVPAVEAFIKQNETLKTDTTLASALIMFGRYPGVARYLSSKHFKSRKGVQIKVHPTAGRKAKQTELKRRSSSDMSFLPKRRPRLAPELDQLNQNLGQNYSSKW